jgi:hypothetical protein
VRTCAICGSSLEGFRSQARYCGGGCRTEARRIRRLVSGVQTGHYATLTQIKTSVSGRIPS